MSGVYPPFPDNIIMNFWGEKRCCFVTSWPVVPLLILWWTFFKPPVLLKVTICWCFGRIHHPITKHSQFLSVLQLNALLYHCACFLWFSVFRENINNWIYIAFVPEALALIAKSNEDKIIFLLSCKLHTFGTSLFHVPQSNTVPFFW
jgi:hypothetical protein